jgi:hypothetical protein
MKYALLILSVLVSSVTYGQFKSAQDSLDYVENYGKYFDCKYEKGNVLIVKKKGKTIDPNKSWKPTKNGFTMRIEGAYDLEFADGKRYRTGIIKSITEDSLSITSTMNESSATYEGIKYEIIKYALQDIKIAWFISDRTLGLYTKKKIDTDYEVYAEQVDKAKLCPAVLTFPKRNNEVKVCHYFLTDQGYDIIFETNGFIDYMQYPVNWQ